MLSSACLCSYIVFSISLLTCHPCKCLSIKTKPLQPSLPLLSTTESSHFSLPWGSLILSSFQICLCSLCAQAVDGDEQLHCCLQREKRTLGYTTLTISLQEQQLLAAFGAATNISMPFHSQRRAGFHDIPSCCCHRQRFVT